MSFIMWLFFKRKELVEFSCGTSQAFAFECLRLPRKICATISPRLDGMIFPPFFHVVCNSYGEFLFLKFSILSLIEKFVLVQKSQIKSEEWLKK